MDSIHDTNPDAPARCPRAGISSVACSHRRFRMAPRTVTWTRTSPLLEVSGSPREPAGPYLRPTRPRFSVLQTDYATLVWLCDLTIIYTIRNRGGPQHCLGGVTSSACRDDMTLHPRRLESSRCTWRAEPAVRQCACLAGGAHRSSAHNSVAFSRTRWWRRTGCNTFDDAGTASLRRGLRDRRAQSFIRRRRDRRSHLAVIRGSAVRPGLSQ